MRTFILLTRLDPEVLRSPASMEDIEKRAAEHIEIECPDVKWLHSYVLLGPYDYLDIFRAQDMESALKVSALIRTFGRAHSEIWGGARMGEFQEHHPFPCAPLEGSLPRRGQFACATAINY